MFIYHLINIKLLLTIYETFEVYLLINKQLKLITRPIKIFGYF